MGVHVMDLWRQLQCPTRIAQPRLGVMPMMEINTNSVPATVRLVKAAFRSSVLRVRPEMKNTVQMLIKVTT